MMQRMALTGGILLLLMAGRVGAGDSPNFLIIMADDCTYNDLPAYGGQNASTPNLDALASQSLVFDRAFLSSAMCQPCRAELYTGQYPMRNGCAWNHSASRNGGKSLPQHLSGLGYRVGIAGKVHVQPRSVFPFVNVPGFDKSCVRDPTREHSMAGVASFMQDAEPFCLVVALVEPHVPWVMGDASAYPPGKIKLPPNLADTPLTRKDFGRYLAEITYMDQQVGEILNALENAGKSDETLVLFTSEQGSQFPGCKWTNWNTGVHTALMARWPGKVQPGRTQALVQYADVLPTLVDAAVGSNSQQSQESIDGSSFLPVLFGQATEHRDYTFHMHNNIPEGPAYPIRAITNGKFHYIRNLAPESLYIEKHLMGIKDTGKLNNQYWASWVWNSEASERTYQLVSRYMQRPAEELYDLENDPYEMNNLLANPSPALLAQKDLLSKALDEWMLGQGDPGMEQDTKLSHQAAKKGEHRFVPPTP